MDDQPTLEELEAVFGKESGKPRAPAGPSLAKGQPTLEELEAAFGKGAGGGDEEDLTSIIDPVASFGAGLAKGIAGLGSLPALAQRGLLKAAEKGYLPKPKHPVMIPTVEEMTDADILKHEPQTIAGEYAQTLGEFMPSPGGVTKAVIPALLSETAGQATKGTEYEPYARIGAGIVGGGVAGLPSYLTGPRAARRMVTRATEEASAEEIDRAEKLFNDARLFGIPITRAEALQQVTKGATSLDDIQRYIEGSGGLRSFMAGRPEQTESAARDLFEAVSPQPVDPSVLGPRAGEAARKVVQEAHKARTRLSSPAYKVAEQDLVPHSYVEDAVQEIDRLIASDKAGSTHGPLRELRERLVETPAQPGIPAARVPVIDPSTGKVIRYNTTPAIPPTPEKYITDIPSIDRTRKEFRDRIGLTSESPKAIDKDTGSKILKVMGDLNAKAEAASPALRAARDIHRRASRALVEPVEAGPTGQIAKEGIGTVETEGALFPSSPLPGSEASLEKTLKRINRKEPGIARQLVRTHLERTFNEASQQLISGDNQFGGAKFAAIIAGNPQQRKNLMTAIGAMPGGQAILPGVEAFFDILQATGQRQRIGSKTAFNIEFERTLKGGTPVEKAFVLKKIRDWVDNISAGKNTEELSRLLTDPAAAADFKTLATGDSFAKTRALSRLATKTAAYAAKTGARTGQQFSVEYNEREGRATGGKVGLTSDRLIAMAKTARRKIQGRTQEILKQPDEHVVRALKAVNDKMQG